MTTSGSTSFTSLIARSSRFGTKYGPPQCRSESWAIVNDSCGRPFDTGAKCTSRPRKCALKAVSERTAIFDRGGARNARFPGICRQGTAAFRQRGGARVRQDPRLLRSSLAIRAGHVRARAGRGGPRRRGVRARLLPSGAAPVSRDHRDETVAGDTEEPQAQKATQALSRRPGEALLPPGHRAARPALRSRARVLTRDPDTRI